MGPASRTPTAGGSWASCIAPDFATAQAQHDELCRQLESAGAEVFHLPAASDLSLDAVYTHDPSLATDQGLIGLHPGKPNRIPEAQRHVEFCREPGHPECRDKFTRREKLKPATWSGSIPPLC